MSLFSARRAVSAQSGGFLDIVTIDQLRAFRNRVHAEGAMRARCMVVTVDERTALCRVLGRYKMYVDLRDRGFVPHLMFEGYWEYWITAFIWRNVKPGQVALDLGANHGYYSVLLADLVGETGRVHAFEPNPRMAELLDDNVAVNGFWRTVRTHAVAIGEAAADAAPLLVPLHDPKNARMLTAGELIATGPDTARQAVHQVPVVTLDAAIEGAVDFVKMDIEGGEDAAWRGMQGLIARSPGIGILMEFNPGRCAEPGSTLAAMAARFPLREVTFDGHAVPVTAADILARSEDTILYLSANEPA